MAGKANSEDERQYELQHLTDTTPLAGMEETFSADGPGVPHVEPTKKNGLPADVPLRVALTDPNLMIEEGGDRKWRRQWDTDEDGVEKTGSERWVEVEYRGATETEVEG